MKYVGTKIVTMVVSVGLFVSAWMIGGKIDAWQGERGEKGEKGEKGEAGKPIPMDPAAKFQLADLFRKVNLAELAMERAKTDDFRKAERALASLQAEGQALIDKLRAEARCKECLVGDDYTWVQPKPDPVKQAQDKQQSRDQSPPASRVEAAEKKGSKK